LSNVLAVITAVVLFRAATPSRANRFAKLDVIKNGEVIEKVALGQQACIVLGRREDVCDYELQHPSISRQHAALIHDKHEQINVLDLGSSQGTFVNDREIEPEKPVVLEGMKPDVLFDIIIVNAGAFFANVIRLCVRLSV
jgi:pSer/pThr/pTyr-binding forkhead associated (FHA) protein